MTEPHAPGQHSPAQQPPAPYFPASGAQIPRQYQQAPDAWPPIPAPKRNRSARVAVLMLVGVLVLCSGVAGTAIYATTRQYGIGAPTPGIAADVYLTGVYQHQEATEAERVLCQQADPTALVTKKIDEARSETDKYDAIFSWGTLAYSDQTASKTTVTTTLRSISGTHPTTTELDIQTINSNGWWVCGVKSMPE